MASLEGPEVGSDQRSVVVPSGEVLSGAPISVGPGPRLVAKYVL